jgi:UrcA family protein
LTKEIIMKSNVSAGVPLACATALLLTCVFGGSAIADEPVRTETVKFRDLNVNTPEGAQALYLRIHAAAKRVCSETDPTMIPAAIACTDRAERDAVEKLNLAQLTAYYKIKTKTGDYAQPLVAAR